MGALSSGFKDIINHDSSYRDLRFIADDKTVLANPHKGWYWHYIDNGFRRGAYRDKQEKGDYCHEFPGLNHLYLRFDWADIEIEDGVFDWSYIDKIMDEWGKEGYRFSFRICSYEGSEKLAFSTPEYLYKQGASGSFIKGAWEPDYGDPLYLDKLERFMAEYGRKFNNDQRVEIIDVGTFGTWGEGHTYAGSGQTWPLEVMKKHVDLHVKYFPDTYILLNDDFINHRGELDRNENQVLLDYCVQRGLGLRDDSICVAYYSDVFGYDTLRSGWMFDYFYKQAPIDIEFEHYNSTTDERFKAGFPFLAALERTKATFAGFHGYPHPWLDKWYYLAEYCANRLGYWYFLEGLMLPDFTAGMPSYLSFFWNNRGLARGYWKYDLKIRLKNISTSAFHIITLPEADNRRYNPGITEERIKVIIPDIEKGEYSFGVGMFEGKKQIMLGIKKDRFSDGFYDVAKININ